MIYDITDRVKEAWDFYDGFLDRKLEKICELSGVSREQLVKINPAEFIEKNKHQKIEDYNYIKIGEWIKQHKTDETYLISPCDDTEKTAAQISYKEGNARQKVRASKCKIVPIPNIIAEQFYKKNHRQNVPQLTKASLSFGLVKDGILIGAMSYDRTEGAVRGKLKCYELMRLSFKKDYLVNGGASRLQKHCEEALLELGEEEIMSYSNATINSGKVYRELGFKEKAIDGGQPFVIMGNNKLVRLINLYPNSTDKKLALYGRIKTHIGGNKKWVKKIKKQPFGKGC